MAPSSKQALRVVYTRGLMIDVDEVGVDARRGEVYFTLDVANQLHGGRHAGSAPPVSTALPNFDHAVHASLKQEVRARKNFGNPDFDFDAYERARHDVVGCAKPTRGKRDCLKPPQQQADLPNNNSLLRPFAISTRLQQSRETTFHPRVVDT